MSELLTDVEAVIAALKHTGDYDDVTCDRVKTILLAPHKHKDRLAHKKTRQTGHPSHSVTYLLIINIPLLWPSAISAGRRPL